MIEIVSGANVILSTPTGTGKSLVAIGAHAYALAQGWRSYYTAPIKALVSEKFFALVDVFGAANVGMVTGDSSVNPDAPIICCTAEILANLALRHGPEAPVQQVVMDEFHYYADPDRGWAWQVPLLDAAAGAVPAHVRDARRRDRARRGPHPPQRPRDGAGSPASSGPCRCTTRYELEPIHDSIDQLLHSDQAPIYIVHFSQLAALERAQALSSAGIATREQRDRIAAEIGGFRFTTAFGKTLNRLLRLGIGVHHAGMLPKYRRLVEQLAQQGLLRVICGTDTLGVGINVPIRTVLLTALTKFDGTRMRQLTAREFHQIAGRAGRAGYDTAGTVVVQAPEHESENRKALAKMGDDPKKRRKWVVEEGAGRLRVLGRAELPQARRGRARDAHLAHADHQRDAAERHRPRRRRVRERARPRLRQPRAVAAAARARPPRARHLPHAARRGRRQSDRAAGRHHRDPPHGRPAAELRAQPAPLAVRARRVRAARARVADLRARRDLRARVDARRPAPDPQPAAVPGPRRGRRGDEGGGHRVRGADGAARGGHASAAPQGAARGGLRVVRLRAAVGARLPPLPQVGRARHGRAGDDLRRVLRALQAVAV